jgi:protein SCO1/2
MQSLVNGNRLRSATRTALRRGALALTAAALACAGGVAYATEAASAAQPAAAPASGLRVSTSTYEVPDITMVRDDGRRVSLRAELDDGRPVLLNFVFTTCPGVCPIMSATFAAFQQRIAVQGEPVHMVSISIDPEQDTPARLREYARRFAAGAQWQYYTGSVEASIAAQRAFDNYRGDKMNHDPLTLMRAAPGQPWVRIAGFATGEDLVRQYRSMNAQRTSAVR